MTYGSSTVNRKRSSTTAVTNIVITTTINLQTVEVDVPDRQQPHERDRRRRIPSGHHTIGSTLSSVERQQDAPTNLAATDHTRHE